MALTRVTAGSEASIDDLNQIIDLLQGTSGFTEAFLLRCATSSDFKVRLSDAAGARRFEIQDSAGTAQAYVDSDGNLTATGLTLSGSFVLPQGAAAAPTAEGSIAWDTDDNLLKIGDGATTQTFYPGAIPTAVTLSGLTKKYKTATQVFSTNTTYADVTASSGNMAFSIGASEVWLAEWLIMCTAGGTGGVKFQLTGPSAPTAVNIVGQVLLHTNDASASTAAIPPFLSTSYSAGSTPASMLVTSFSSSIMGINSGNSTGVDNTWHQSVGSPMRIVALIINGSNAGTVTLQAAQNSSNSTTTLGIGSWMRAERIA